MRKKSILQVVCTAMMLLLCSGMASALNVSHYATQSKLATGKWVKISIPETGVYEITNNELREMGFNNPSSVRLYGFGGNRISEVLNGLATDDLVSVPLMRTGDKICFYGNGPIRFTYTNYSTNPRFSREFNPYAQEACYFLTEDGSADNLIAFKPLVTLTSYIDKPTSMTYLYHEKELISIGKSGKEMMGEDFLNDRLLVDYYLPNLADSTIMVQTALAAYPDSVSYANALIHSGGATDMTVYSSSMARLEMPTSLEFYSAAAPYGLVRLTHPAEHGQFEPIVTSDAEDNSLSLARLDYFIITYTHDNIIREEDDNQTIMAYAKPKGTERFLLPGATSSTVVWLINDTKSPLMMHLEPYNDASGDGYSFCSTSSSRAVYVAFDPAKTLKKISKFETVANQNLHGMETPELLILTDKIFHEQAERIAEMHRVIDGIDVAVVDQDQVFNEFSSGTRDAMAYRLFCKMLYDRNPEKFKHLLLVGTGSLDNREIFGEHPGFLLTYQSDNSNSESNSYTTDDFFGFLADNSGTDLATDRLSISVGRISCVDVEEAKNDVDKLIEYYTNPDYGVWRNNTMVFSDSPDKGKYMFHGEGYKNQIDNALSTGMHVSTVHNSMYPRSTTQPNTDFTRREAVVGKQKLSRIFKNGVYFGTYVGHAGITGYTKYNKMWVTTDVINTPMRYLPIMSTACCDVARFDGDQRGVAEHMFHMRNGGAIALMTASRTVYSNYNDKLNTRFINALFSNATQGRMPTLGEAFVESKQYDELNKLKFLLLGDPAMRINYPVSRFNITKINTTNMTSASAMAQISPLMRFDIEARVLDNNGTLDSGFNGDATVTLYDKEDYFTTVNDKVNGVSTDRDIYTDREKLAEVSGRVVNGVFHGQMIVPEHPEASNETVLLRVYAHQDNSSVMVNGFTKNITMLPYNEQNAIEDDTAPVVNSMFINDEITFVNGAIIAPDAILYISASDDQGINVQSNSVDQGMNLMLDGGKVSYNDVNCFVTTDDNGRVVNVEYPLSNLSEGQHTLTFTVCDLLGNLATRSITFIVGQNMAADIVADKLPAYLNDVVSFDLKDSELSVNTNFIVRVTDATGKLMWMTTTDSFPVTWDMKDQNGNKVPAGLYRYFGTYNNGTNYGGTPINKLIVLDPVKTEM